MTLTQRQEAAIKAMQEPRTSEKRAAKHRAAVLGAYRRQAFKLGYMPLQVEQQIRDIRDMYALTHLAE